MNASEIRADMVSELRAAANGYQALGVRNMHLAGTCRDLAAQLISQADLIESREQKVESRNPENIFSQSPNSTRLADGSTAARVDFKLNAAAPSSAANFQPSNTQIPKYTNTEMECVA
jgi:hypothetical protein